MTYTFFPIPPIDTVHNHAGLFIVCMVSTFGLFIGFFNFNSDEFKRIFVIVAAAIGISSFVSFHTGSITEYKNEPVKGEFVGFVAEGYNEARASGKSIRHVDVHNTYVVYEVDGTRVLFEATRGLAYPQIATLYRN